MSKKKDGGGIREPEGGIQGLKHPNFQVAIVWFLSVQYLTSLSI